MPEFTSVYLALHRIGREGVVEDVSVEWLLVGFSQVMNRCLADRDDGESVRTAIQETLVSRDTDSDALR